MASEAQFQHLPYLQFSTPFYANPLRLYAADEIHQKSSVGIIICLYDAYGSSALTQKKFQRFHSQIFHRLYT